MRVNFLFFLAKRLSLIAISLVVIISISYTLLWYAPGNYLDVQRAYTSMSTQFAQNSEAYKLQKAMFEERYGLNKPLYAQIWTYVKNAATFNFGPSFQTPTVLIQDMVRERLPRTLTIVLLGIGLALLVGIPLGVLAGFRRNTWIDYVVTGFSMVGQIVPVYVLAIVFILVFAGKVWNVLPGGGWSTPWPKPQELVLPVLTLALGPIAGIARFTRNQVAETMSQEFIRTARSKGVPERFVIMRHALRNSLIPVVTTTAPQIGAALVGSVWIENIFRIPGIGQLFATALGARDYPLMITSVVILALGVMLANLIADILYSVLDPRIKLEA
ncbi:ABC transporter permease [Chloroflexia bacterium SDU3-3]|nr:ABC transporter permease [Chloroflexia bacterium SDU3-3]